MTTKPTKTVKQRDGKIVTYFTENKLWVKAFENGRYAWEKRNRKYAQELVASPDVVIDIGANIGQEALQYSDWARKVYSFEPNPVIFEVLDLNVKQNNLTNVEIIAKGASNAAGSAVINNLRANEGRSYVCDHNGKHTLPIELITIDDYLLHNIEGRVDFVKMDVEGHEVHALEGMKKLIEKFWPVFQVEAEDECLERCGYDSTHIWDFFNERGYVATINTGEVITREKALTDNRSRVDLFFKKIKE
jgi:FkbM family methyltransferase